jgi:hypothetical protein
MASAFAAVERLGHWDPFIEALIPSGGIERGIPADALPAAEALSSRRSIDLLRKALSESPLTRSLPSQRAAARAALRQKLEQRARLLPLRTELAQVHAALVATATPALLPTWEACVQRVSGWTGSTETLFVAYLLAESIVARFPSGRPLAIDTIRAHWRDTDARLFDALSLPHAFVAELSSAMGAQTAELFAWTEPEQLFAERPKRSGRSSAQQTDVAEPVMQDLFAVWAYAQLVRIASRAKGWYRADQPDVGLAFQLQAALLQSESRSFQRALEALQTDAAAAPKAQSPTLLKETQERRAVVEQARHDAAATKRSRQGAAKGGKASQQGDTPQVLALLGDWRTRNASELQLNAKSGAAICAAFTLWVKEHLRAGRSLDSMRGCAQNGCKHVATRALHARLAEGEKGIEDLGSIKCAQSTLLKACRQ